MRVLLIANTLPPRDLSGVGEQVLQLASGLREAGHEVEILGRGGEVELVSGIATRARDVGLHHPGAKRCRGACADVDEHGRGKELGDSGFHRK